MSNNVNVGGEGIYSGYEGVLKHYDESLKHNRWPKLVRPKVQQKKYLKLQFKDPSTGKRTTKGCNVSFTIAGIETAINKAWKTKEALESFTSAAEFLEWYKQEIEGENRIENDLKTYHQIFQEIEDKYYKGLNPNTKRKRSRKIDNDNKSFNDYYGSIFKKFSDWDKYPTWVDFEKTLNNYKKGAESYRKCVKVLKNIAEYSGSKRQLLEKLNCLDTTKTKFREKQSISLSEFNEWRESTIISVENKQKKTDREAGLNWLWVSAMGVLYGLRATEVAAANNLTKPFVKDGVTIPAITDPNNEQMLLVLNDFTFFGASIKTGWRVCMPFSTDKEFIEGWNIRDIRMPQTKSRSSQNFANKYNNWLRKNSPITQTHAYRHLYNQQCELRGIPVAIRSRSLGHSEAVNMSTYKSRSNIQTTVQLLTEHHRQPLDLELAKKQITDAGIDLNNEMVQSILKIIYQL